MNSASNFEVTTPLVFPLVLVDETVIATLGEAAEYIAAIPPVYRGWAHWKTAMQMVIRAAHEEEYLQAATVAFQTALLIDARLSRPHPVDLY